MIESSSAYNNPICFVWGGEEPNSFTCVEVLSKRDKKDVTFLAKAMVMYRSNMATTMQSSTFLDYATIATKEVMMREINPAGLPKDVLDASTILTSYDLQRLPVDFKITATDEEVKAIKNSDFGRKSLVSYESKSTLNLLLHDDITLTEAYADIKAMMSNIMNVDINFEIAGFEIYPATVYDQIAFLGIKEYDIETKGDDHWHVITSEGVFCIRSEFLGDFGLPDGYDVQYMPNEKGVAVLNILHRMTDSSSYVYLN